MSPVENQLYDLMQRKTGVRPNATDSFEVLQIDSLAMAELTVEIEKAFGIRLDDDVMDLSDMAELVAYIQARLERRMDA
ncbi:MAG: acyl carrier protein [Pirellulaceae bacterium]